MFDVAGISPDSIVDGPGLRMVIFSQGCPHHCPGCHNPETWEMGTGIKMSEAQLLTVIAQNPLCKGITFSGGEPFAQAEQFAHLAQQLKANGYEVAAYSGYTFEQLLAGTAGQQELLRSLDILIDGPFILAERSLNLMFRGSRNQRILNVPASLEQNQAVWTDSVRWVGEN